MTIDRTRSRATKRTEVMERIRNRIILEHKDLLILVINLENPQGWREMHEIWKTGKPAGTDVSSQECKVQRLDISTRYARPRKELNREPILFKTPG